MTHYNFLMITFYKDALKDRILKQLFYEENLYKIGSHGSLLLCENNNIILIEHPKYNIPFEKFLMKDLEWYFKTI